MAPGQGGGATTERRDRALKEAIHDQRTVTPVIPTLFGGRFAFDVRTSSWNTLQTPEELERGLG